MVTVAASAFKADVVSLGPAVLQQPTALLCSVGSITISLTQLLVMVSYRKAPAAPREHPLG